MKSTLSRALFSLFLFGLVLFGASPAVSAIQPEVSGINLEFFLGVMFFVSYIVIASLSDPKDIVRRSYTKIFA